MRKRYSLLLLSAILFSSCQFLDGSSADETQGTDIEFTSNIKDLLDDEGVNSIDLIAYKPNGEPLWNMDWFDYHYAGDVLTAVNDDQEIYYTEDAPELYFHAYYPEYYNKNSYSISEDPQYLQYNDFQFASTELTASPIVELNFEHMLTKLRIIFTSGNLPEYVRLPEILAAYTFNPQSKSVEPISDSSVELIYTLEDGNLIAEFILPPQILSNSYEMVKPSCFGLLGIYNSEYPLCLDSQLEPKSGYQYDITVDCIDEINNTYTISDIKESKWE